MNKKHGHYVNKKPSSTYYSWSKMKERCNNPKSIQYRDYGGRGISVCEEWKEFSGFLKDMGDRPDGMTLDRINNDGNYCKSNCKWSTREEQGKNHRLFKTNTSGYNGVSPHKNGGFVTSIHKDGKNVHLGTFDTAEEAFNVRQRAAK